MTAWTSPPTFVALATLPASQLNTYLRDNPLYLKEQSDILLSRFVVVNTTTVGNVGTGTDDLMTYALPANTLDADGRVVRVTGHGKLSAAANGKTITFDFGAASIILLNTSIVSVAWRAVVEIVRTGAATQRVWGSLTAGNTATANSQSVANWADGVETLSGAVTLKFTGTAVATDDITQTAMIVEVVG